MGIIMFSPLFVTSVTPPVTLGLCWTVWRGNFSYLQNIRGISESSTRYNRDYYKISFCGTYFLRITFALVRFVFCQ